MDTKSKLDNVPPPNSAKARNWYFGMWMLPIQWMLPIHMTAACWESWMVVSDGFCRTVFQPGDCPEADNTGNLAVPPALQDKGEHDLFA